jgi:hypothetical protein
MATHSHVQVPPDSTGKKVDNVVVDTDKFRQVTATGDAENLAAIQRVKDTAAAADDQAAVVRASSLGEQADAAVVTDANGSISGKLRGLVKWAFERMPASLGAKVSAESLPVVLALDQPRVGVWVAGSTGGLGSLTENGETLSMALDGNATGSVYLSLTGLTGTLEVLGSDGGVRFYSVPLFDGTTMRTSKAFVDVTQEETWHLVFPAGTTAFKLVLSDYSAGSVDSIEATVAATAPTTHTWLGSVAPTVGQKPATESLPVTLSDENAGALNDVAQEATLATLAANAATEATLLDVLAEFAAKATEITLSAIHDILDDRLPAALGQTTMAGSFPVTMASDQPTLPETVTSTGTMTATNDPVTVELNGHTGVGARVVASGTFAGTVIMEASMDGTNFFSIQFVNIASGSVASGMAFVGGLHGGVGNHHISAILPAGLTHVRVRLSTVSAGTCAATVNATVQTDFSPRYVGASAVAPGPTQGLQIGGAASLGGEFQLVNVQAVNPGISGSKQALVVVPWGLPDPGGSAGGYPFRLVAGRDPTSNAVRQLDLYPGVLSGTGWNGLVVRPYRASDGAGNSEPLKHTSDAAAYMRDGHQALPALSFKVFHEPAVNTVATITQASAGAGKRNVCTGITVTLASDGTAPAAVQVFVRLRDGASGAGTVVWSTVISLPAVAGAMVNITRSNIWIEGSQATAMTLEFSAAGGANTIESVSMEGVILTE